MRKDNPIPSSSSSSNAAVSGCKTTSGTDCIETRHNSLSVGTSHTISHANFILTSSYFGTSGGAISLSGGSKKTSTSIEVSHSTFKECYAAEGAGIYVNGIASLKVSSSLFYNCGSTSTVRGGGICMYSVNSHDITDNQFVSLQSSYDGGGLYLSGCTRILNSATVKDNYFILCKCTGRGDSSGGAAEANTNSCPRFSSCLFSHCKAVSGGGALWLFGAYPSLVLTFSFFHDNEESNNRGHDCCFRDGSDDQLCVQCFSATQRTPRVYPSGHDNNWHP